MKKQTLTVVLIVLLLAGALSILFIFNPSGNYDSGIIGNISYGPVSPVCIQGTPCYKMYSGNVTVSGSFGSNVVSANKGYFKISLHPGVYTVKVDGFLSSCQKDVSIVKGNFSQINLKCDTGIR